MGLNYATLDTVKNVLSGARLASNLRLVMWPVEGPTEEMREIWQMANRHDFVLMADNLREEEGRVIADFDYGRYGAHTVSIVVGSYITTVPYLGRTYEETKEYGDFFHR